MDSSGFNLPLAKKLRETYPDKEIIYYILPQAWAWKKGRVAKLEKYCSKLCSIIPFEGEMYSDKNKLTYVGHPLLDEIKEFKVRIENEYKNVNIVFINYSMEDLTPEFIINNKIYTIIMYHGLEWLNKQVGLLNIVKNPLLNRELIVPALVDNLAIDKANKKLFEELSKRMGTILTLQFVDARYFSPERLEK